MPTISHTVQKLINRKLLLKEALSKGIASYGAIAKQIKNEVEKELGIDVKEYAIVTALRRYVKKLNNKNHSNETVINLDTDFNLRTNILYISILKSPSLLSKIKELHNVVEFEKGDVLNISYGRNHVSIITNERYKRELLQYLSGEKLLAIKEGLVSFSLANLDNDIQKTLVLFKIVEDFLWAGIDIYSISSTENEVTILLYDKDALKGYELLENSIKNRKIEFYYPSDFTKD